MVIRNDRREAAIERMADYILAEGLGAATLRPLAAAAGTSDRMLLYYFVDKDELLAATLDRITARMIVVLDEVIPTMPRLPFDALLQQSWAALTSDQLRLFMPVWLDLAANASRGREPHRTIGRTIADGFLAWVDARLLPENVSHHSRQAPLFLAVVEGAYLLRGFGLTSIANTAIDQVRNFVKEAADGSSAPGQRVSKPGEVGPSSL